MFQYIHDHWSRPDSTSLKTFQLVGNLSTPRYLGGRARKTTSYENSTRVHNERLHFLADHIGIQMLIKQNHNGMEIQE